MQSLETENTPNASNEERLTNLEILVTQQDDMVETLSRLVHEQRLQLEKMQMQLSQLQDKVSWARDGEIVSEQDEPPPPHY